MFLVNCLIVVTSISEAVNFYLAVRDLVIKGHSKAKAIAKMGKRNNSFYRIEPLARLYLVMPQKFMEVYSSFNLSSWSMA